MRRQGAGALRRLARLALVGALVAMLAVPIRATGQADGPLPAAAPGAVPDGYHWAWRDPLPQGNDLTDIAYGGGVYVTVSILGDIIRSGDGQHWDAVYPKPTTAGLRRVVYGGDYFVAAGGGKQYLVSKDGGRSWETRLLPDKVKQVLSIHYLNGVWLMLAQVDSPDRLYALALNRSTDAITWTHVSAHDLEPQCVAASSSNYVMAGFNHDLQQYTFSVSSDGQRWNIVGSEDSKNFFGCDSLYYAGGHWILTRYAGTTDQHQWIYTSPDGATWTLREHTNHQGAVRSLAFGNGVYVTDWNRMISQDGVKWEHVCDLSGPAACGPDNKSLPFLHDWDSDYSVPGAIRFVNDAFYAVGHSGVIYTSTDGRNWTTVSVRQSRPLARVLYSAGVWVAVGARDELRESFDAKAWSVVTLTNGPIDGDLSGLAYGNGHFVAVGSQSEARVGESLSTQLSGRIATSTDDKASIWTVQQVRPQLRDIAYGAGWFVAVGEQVLVSRDGLTWTQLPGADMQRFYTVTYGNGRFVLTDGWGDRLAATLFPPSAADGTWTLKASSLTGFECTNVNVVYAQGRFLAAACNGQAQSSVDGLTWAPEPKVPGGLFRTDLYYAGGAYFSPESAQVHVSPDGRSWQTYWGPLGHFSAVAYGDGQLVAVGSGIVSYPWSPTALGKSPCAPYTDLAQSDPVCGALAKLRGLVNGYPDGTFRLDHRVTRAEAAKLLVLALKLPPLPDATAPFSDVSHHWAAEQGYIQAAVQARLLNGYPDGTFRPDRAVTRAELVKLVATAAGLAAGDKTPYSDIGSGDWFAGAVAAVARAHLIGASAPYPLWTEPDFSGGDWAVRSEAALLLANFLQFRPS